MELLNQSSFAEEPSLLLLARTAIGHGREVDASSSAATDRSSGWMVKTAASVDGRDIGALRYLRDKLGERFEAGVVIHTGETTVPFADRLGAVPLSGLWAPGVSIYAARSG